MRNINMSDAFKLPVKRVNSGVMDSGGKFLNGAKHAEYSAIAINSHDKLTEEKNILREALELILKTKNYVDIDIIASEALEQTK